MFAKAITPSQSFRFAFALVFPSTAAVFGFFLLTNRRATMKVAARYGLVVGWGTYEFQERSIQVRGDSSRVVDVAAAALRRVHPDMHVDSSSSDVVTGRRDADPPEGRLAKLPSAVRVTLATSDAGGTVLHVTAVTGASRSQLDSVLSRCGVEGLAAPSGLSKPIFDHGRSIENIEEFQISFKQLIEGVSDSEGGQRDGR